MPEQLTFTGSRLPPRRRRRRRYWLRRFVALLTVLALAVVGVAIYFALSIYQPFHGKAHGRILVTIPKNAGVSEVGSVLAKAGVIDSGFFFKLRAELDGDAGKIRAGTYPLPHGMTYAAALKRLTTGPPPPPVTRVTIVPGRSRTQVDKLLRSEGVKGSYLRLTRRSRDLDPVHYGAPANTPSLEGFLYPDTYELFKPVSIRKLVADQLSRFKQEFARVNLSYARSKGLTPYDVLTIASLVEGESRVPSDGPKVAAVIYNRLRDNMELGLDSTVAYFTGNYRDNFTVKQLNSPSPYNTYNHRGLPPTPIDSPDLQAIQDAAHPAKTKDLYFVNKVCGNGRLAFTTTYHRFLQLSAAYHRALVNAEKHHRSAEFC